MINFKVYFHILLNLRLVFYLSNRRLLSSLENILSSNDFNLNRVFLFLLTHVFQIL